MEGEKQFKCNQCKLFFCSVLWFEQTFENSYNCSQCGYVIPRENGPWEYIRKCLVWKSHHFDNAASSIGVSITSKKSHALGLIKIINYFFALFPIEYGSQVEKWAERNKSSGIESSHTRMLFPIRLIFQFLLPVLSWFLLILSLLLFSLWNNKQEGFSHKSHWHW